MRQLENQKQKEINMIYVQGLIQVYNKNLNMNEIDKVPTKCRIGILHPEKCFP